MILSASLLGAGLIYGTVVTGNITVTHNINTVYLLFAINAVDKTDYMMAVRGGKDTDTMYGDYAFLHTSQHISISRTPSGTQLTLTDIAKAYYCFIPCSK